MLDAEADRRAQSPSRSQPLWAWLLDGLALLLTMFLVQLTSNVVFDEFAALLVFLPLAAVVVVLWLIRTTVQLRRARLRQQPLRRHAAAMLLIPLLALVCAGLLTTDLARSARFRLSRPALDRAAAQVMEGDGDAPDTGDWVGLYRVDEARAIPGGMRMKVRGAGDVLTECGLAYLPSGPTASEQEEAEYVYAPQLDGPWWQMCQHLPLQD